MIRVLESAYDTRYDIYYKPDKYVGMADSLIHFQRADDLESAIKWCNEFNDEYVQRRTSKGEKITGHFVVISENEIVYESED